jgi:signal transduction histidine kinase
MMNIVNYLALVNEADQLLQVISLDLPLDDADDVNRFDGVPRNMSRRLRDSRFYTVKLTHGGDVESVNIDNYQSVGYDAAVENARAALARGESGFYNNCRYSVSETETGVRVDFIDTSHQINSVRTFIVISSSVSAFAYAIVVLVVLILADRIIRPFAENYEKQKRFITDAGHELKTPVTIIGANADLMEMELGENEYIDEVKTQVSNMKELISTLVYLAKMEEQENTGIKIELPLSEIVEETASSFAASAQLRGLRLEISVTPMLSMYGEDKSIRTLISLLVDNAVKYAVVGTTVEVKLLRQSKYVILTVSNATDVDFDREKLTLIFERFWRNDKSRNSSRGGHGIGLSVARAITENHDGKIMAMCKDGIVTVTATLPINQ